MSEVKGHIIPSTQPMHSFSFHINQTNHSWDMAKIIFYLAKTHLSFFQTERLQNLINSGGRGDGGHGGGRGGNELKT